MKHSSAQPHNAGQQMWTGRISGTEHMWPPCSKPPLQVWQGFKQKNIHLFLSSTDFHSVTHLLAGGVLPKMVCVPMYSMCKIYWWWRNSNHSRLCRNYQTHWGHLIELLFFSPTTCHLPPSLDRTSELASMEEGRWKLFPMSSVGTGLPSPCGRLLRTFSPRPTELKHHNIIWPDEVFQREKVSRQLRPTPWVELTRRGDAQWSWRENVRQLSTVLMALLGHMLFLLTLEARILKIWYI